MMRLMGLETSKLTTWSLSNYSSTSSRRPVLVLPSRVGGYSQRARSSSMPPFGSSFALTLRKLSVAELDLRARKRRVISLAVVECCRKKQCARIANLKGGGANTKFFHHRINARRRKNHFHHLKHNNGWLTDHEHKEAIIHDHFSNVIDKAPANQMDFN